MNLNFSTKKVIRLLVVIVIILTLLSLIGQLYKYFLFEGNDRYLVDLINVDKEKNFPTWFASLNILFCSILLFIISSVKRKTRDSFFYHWFTLSIIFLLMATDEIMQLHEQVITPIRGLLNTTGYLYITWVIPGILFGILFLVVYLKFLIHLPRQIKVLFIMSGLIYVSGAIGFEIIGSNHIYYYGQNNISYALLTAGEEFLEMSGILLFTYTLLKYINIEFPQLGIYFRGNDS
ncbi:MAG: hypothetical protein IH949_05085 [Bacteroidetes bacterium]|nr:hypothetical protein [Bacteroidota bacterium]